MINPKFLKMCEELSHNYSVSTQEPTPNTSQIEKVPDISVFTVALPSQSTLNEWEDLAIKREYQSARYRN